MGKDVECPYCGEELDISHDDGYGYEEGEYHSQQCSNCKKYFAFTTSISYYYEASKADCLNDGNHKWKYTQTYPKEFTKMQCEFCGEERGCTNEEMDKIMLNGHK